MSVILGLQQLACITALGSYSRGPLGAVSDSLSQFCPLPTTPKRVSISGQELCLECLVSDSHLGLSGTLHTGDLGRRQGLALGGLL